MNPIFERVFELVGHQIDRNGAQGFTAIEVREMMALLWRAYKAGLDGNRGRPGPSQTFQQLRDSNTMEPFFTSEVVIRRRLDGEYHISSESQSPPPQRGE
ncbi:MAG: hypothetical protein WCH05_06545 [Chlorobiaceae bacterium]